jgi:hypothetical protein
MVVKNALNAAAVQTSSSRVLVEMHQRLLLMELESSVQGHAMLEITAS